LRLTQGTVTALVGPSGAGKSSVADLVTGLYEPTRGGVFIDGVDLRGVSPADWVRRVAVVSQDTMLFNDSLRENIRFGRPDASDADVEQAGRLAHLDDFVAALPLGYDTVVGERGFMLSGGQRQRVSLARALIRDAEVLILDEATSALDSETEQIVQATLEDARKNKILLVIAHRLSTIKDADTIVVLERGRVVEQGAHTELLARGGRYASLWAAQTATGLGA
jgi:ATP-binding cassette subfamily B protein/subfamily B ATP-binding cassette protein MsbA